MVLSSKLQKRNIRNQGLGMWGWSPEMQVVFAYTLPSILTHFQPMLIEHLFNLLETTPNPYISLVWGLQLVSQLLVQFVLSACLESRSEPCCLGHDLFSVIPDSVAKRTAHHASTGRRGGECQHFSISTGGNPQEQFFNADSRLLMQTQE